MTLEITKSGCTSHILSHPGYKRVSGAKTVFESASNIIKLIMKEQNTVDICWTTNCIFSTHINPIFVQDWRERKDSCVYMCGCARTISHKGWIVSAILMEKNAPDCENEEIM